MAKRLLILSAAVIIMFSLAACSTNGRNPGHTAQSNSSQSIIQDKSTVASSSTSQNNGNEKNSGTTGKISSNTKNNSDSLIDDTISAMKDMGNTASSLEDPSDDDLNVPDPQ